MPEVLQSVLVPTLKSKGKNVVMKINENYLAANFFLEKSESALKFIGTEASRMLKTYTVLVYQYDILLKEGFFALCFP